MKKRLVSITLVVAMAVMLLQGAAFGRTVYAAGDFTIKNGVLTKYNGSGGDVVIPEGVTSISDFAFGLNSTMTSVTIPKTVTAIGEDTFSTCSGLKSFVVKSGNPSYSSQDGVLYNQDMTLLMICPAKKTGTLTIPDTVTSVGDWAFELCGELTGITIPKSLTSISRFTFGACRSLKSISVDSGNSAFSSQDGVLYDKDGTTLVLCPAKKASVMIADSVTTIGEKAFSGCKELKSVSLPDSVLSIGDRAFAECSGLTSVVVPDAVTSIGEHAFYYCAGLKSITIPKTVTSIGWWAFENCDVLGSIYFAGTRQQWENLLTDEYGNEITLCSFYENIRVHYNYTNALKITSQPVNQSIALGDAISLSLKAEGNGLTYQWYFKKAGKSDWTLWKGKTTATITGVADCTWHVMQVYCRVTDETGETADSNTAVAMITKKSSKRYIKRTFKVKSNGTKIYSGPGTNYKELGTLNAGAKYLALEWGSDSSDVTWFRFNWNGKDAWISRKKTTVSDEFETIPTRSFKNGGVPIIYLSPSRQTHNAYAAGSTTEGVQMYRVGNALKKILEDEYLCVVYMPPVEMLINLNARPTDAYNKEADVYLAIHSNANSSGSSYGAVGYYFPACAQSKALGQNMADEMGKISPFTPTVRSKTVNGMTAFDNVGYGEVRDPAYFGMISLLAEVEYHDNADSAKWIINNPNKIARALANALEKTLDMQKK